MAYNGSGVFIFTSTTVTPATANTLIESAEFNTFTADVKSGLDKAICSDGQTTCTARIPFAAGISLFGTNVTSTAAELNILDGVTATSAELNILDGVTATAAELNILDGVTATAAELNILDGVTATAAELNILNGVTSTAAELNILDGVTSTAAEINIIDGDTAATSTTAVATDTVVYNDAGVMKQVTLTDLKTFFTGGLNTVVLDIGDWNMDSTNSKTVSHSLTVSKIRSINVIILDDAGTAVYPLNRPYDSSDGTCQGGALYATSSGFILHRLTGGVFDNTNYDATSYNRGWITIQYTD